MATTNATLPITLRGGFLPVLRYGNYAGPGYAGGIGAETVIEHPDINKGKPILASELTQTPQGLARFMQLALKTEPNGYMDGVTRNHDVEYTVAEIRFMDKVQSQFDGKLPHELSAQDRQDPAFKQLETARDAEYWQADKRMLTSMAQYQPTDLVDATYRDVTLNAFYSKAESDLFGYGLGAEAQDFYNNLKTIDSKISVPTLGDSINTLGTASTLARADFETLATLPITPQERQFFNQHLKPGQYIDASTQDAQGNTITYDNKDSTNRIVVPEQVSKDFYAVRTKMGNDTVTMTLDKTDPLNPVFTKEIKHNDELVSTETIRPQADESSVKGISGVRAYQVVVVDGKGQTLDTKTLAKPEVPDSTIPPDLQQKIDAVKSGDYSHVLQASREPHSADTTDGVVPLDSTSANATPDDQGDGDSASNPAVDNAAPTSTPELKPDLTDEQASALRQDLGLPSSGPQQPGLQLADATPTDPTTGLPTISDAGGGGNSTLSLTTQLADTNLTPAQQATLIQQLNSLGLGDADVTVIPISGGGYILANVEGDIVGSLQGNTGNSSQAFTSPAGPTLHIDGEGRALTDSQYRDSQLQPIADGLGLLSSAASLSHWDQMSDVGKLSTLVSAYNQLDHLGSAFGGSDNNLSGDLGSLGAALNLYSALASGDTSTQILGLASFANSVGNGAVDAALNQTFGTAASDIPYVNIALALNHFEDHPGQSIGNLIGMYWGPIGSTIGSFIGSMLDSIFGSSSAAPPPYGEVSFGWDAHGNTSISTVSDISGGAANAHSVADNIETLLQSMIQGANDHSLETHPDIAPGQLLALNPNLLPRIAYSVYGASLEVPQPDGSSRTETISADTLVERLSQIATDSGAIAPAWLIQTQQQHWQHQQSELAALQVQLQHTQAQLPRTASDENGWGNTLITSGASPAVAAYHQTQQAVAAKQAQIAHETQAGIGGHASAGNQSYALEGNAIDGADFTTQSYGALIIHAHSSAGQTQVQAHAQALGHTLEHIKTIQVLRDVENDSYAENTQWVSATDEQGNPQGVLVLDFNGNGLIETHDILNLGGNRADSANSSAEGALANANADLQRNNVQWLDADGNGVLDQSDPAFGAIKLWVDANADAVMQRGEGQSLAALQITAINFKTGEVSYADGHRDALTAQTLQADTNGIKQTHMFTGSGAEYGAMQAALKSGDSATAQAIAAAHDGGLMLAGEAYAGPGKARNEGAAHWAQTTAQNAVRTGDWEGTPEQEAHRHGGANAADAPVQTSATGAVSLGKVKTVQTRAILQSVIEAGDIRVKSEPKMVFVPAAETSAHGELALVTQAMIQNADSSLFAGLGNSGGASLGALGVVGAAMAVQMPVLASVDKSSKSGNGASADLPNAPQATAASVSNPVFTPVAPVASASAEVSSPLWRAAGLDNFQSAPVIVSTAPVAAPGVSATVVTDWISASPGTAAVLATAAGASGPGMAAPVAASPSPATPVASESSTSTGTSTSTPMPVAASAIVLEAPQVHGETLAGTEDVVLRLSSATLLGNDSSANQAADASRPLLSITAVANPTHGQVGVNNGEVLFIPDANFHGTASFSYTVTDQYGLQSSATATLEIAAVNDAPVTQGESAGTLEDQALYFNAADLLTNDRDVDSATDGQTLSISAIAASSHGTATLTQDGRIRFVPDADFNGVASFTYVVSDGHGGETPARVLVPVSAVNDVPVAAGEVAVIDEDTAIIFTQAQLLANDGDVDVATDGQTLSVSAVSGASNGTVTLLANGDIQFVPNANYHGAAKFTYTVSDGNGGTANANVNLTVLGVNDAPVAVGESVSGSDEDTTLVIAAAALLANDSDVDTASDGQVLRLASVSGATHGTVSLLTLADGTQQVNFVPDANYHGPVQFSYTVTDGNGGTATAIATLNLAAVNDVPVATGEVAVIDEDTAIIFTQAQLLANDTDNDTGTDGQTLSVSAVSGASNGMVTLLANGDIRFIPDANYHGAAQFTYTVSDGNGGTASATVNLTVLAVNDTPVAIGDILSIAEDAAITIGPAQLLANDSDADMATDGDFLTITRVFDAQHGTVALNADGTIALTPESNYHGNTRFSYEVADRQGAVSTTMVVAGVNAVNDAPVAHADSASSLEDNIVLFNQSELLANDTDADIATDGDRISVASVGNAAHGTVRMLANGQVEFTPELNFHGMAGFDYVTTDTFGANSTAHVTLAVGAVNDAPVAVDETLAGAEDTTLVIAASALLANDSDVDTSSDGQVLSIASVSDASHGTVSLLTLADGTQQVNFVPDANYHGAARFSNTVTDGNGGTATAIATLNVAAVNDVPVATGEVAVINEDAALIFTQAQLLANDTDNDTGTDGQTLSVSAVSGASNGTVTLLANGDVRFIPDVNYHGAAQFTYTVSDGNGGTANADVNLTVLGVNDAPVAVGESVSGTEDTTLAIAASSLLVNDSDVDTTTDGQVLRLASVSGATHGTVSLMTLADGTQQVNFVPDANYHGPAQFSYTVTDGNGGTTSAIATLNLAAVNDVPVVQGETATVDEDNTVYFSTSSLLANDTDVDVASNGQTLAIASVSGATNGTAGFTADGRVFFTPNANYFGSASFGYTVSDGAGGSADGMVQLAINPVNDAPVALGESTGGSEDNALLIAPGDLLANDSDIDDAQNTLMLTAVASAQHGSAALIAQADGGQRILFTPDANYHGTASFQYTVSDPHGLTSTATATIAIAAVNDAPVTANETAQTDEDVGLIFTPAQLLANDTDADVMTDGDGLHVSRVGAAQHGTAFIDGSGQVRFVPDVNYHGAAQFSYWVTDTLGAETPATVNITVAAVNDLPVATGEQTTSAEDTILYIDPATLLANDTDVDGASNGQVLSVSAVSNATHGTVTLLGSGAIRFIPEANFHGLAGFDYTVSDGVGGTAVATAVVNLTAVNDAPVTTSETASGSEDNELLFSSAALLANDSDVDTATDGQTLSVSRVGAATNGSVSLDAAGTVHFTPNANYHGAAQFTYWVADTAGVETPATVNLTIAAMNDVPVVNGEVVNSQEDAGLLFDPATLLANDSDVDSLTDGQVLKISAVSNAQHGTVTLQADGRIAFVPEGNFYGAASFDYTVSDGAGGTRIATTSVNLAAVNDAPGATGESISSTENQPLLIAASALLQNDGDVDNAHSELRIARVQAGVGGGATLDANGNVLFTPTPGYNGAATLTYWVRDPAGAESNPVTTTVLLAAVNDAPTAQGEVVYGASEDAVFHIDKSTLLANDNDVDDPHAALGLSWVGSATGGAVGLDASGNVVFTPTPNFNGNASFEYRVRDAAGLESPTVTAVIPVAAVNDVPLAVDDQFQTYRNSQMTIGFEQLTGNDSDVEGDALTVSSVANAQGGTAWIENGAVRFNPTTGFSGMASFQYLAGDQHGGQTWATSYVQVREPPNQYPTISIVSASASGYSSGYSFTVYLGATFSVADDGDPNAVSLSLVSAQFRTFSATTWTDASGGYSLDRAGNSFYFSGQFNVLETTWRLVDDRGLENTWHNTLIASNPNSNYWMVSDQGSTLAYSGYYYPPLVMDLNGDGVHFTSIQDSNVAFDVNHDGIADKMAWAAHDDGVLIWDKDHNGQVTDASEFGFNKLKEGAATDLEGLQTLDSNHNGELDAGDEKWTEFAVWQDANGNGVTDAGEFKTLDQLGMSSIHLQSNGQVRDAGTALAGSSTGETDVTVMGDTVFTRSDGTTGTVADAMLAYQPGPVPAEPAPVDQTAETARMALLFNQMVNTATDGYTQPLGFVPIETDASMYDASLMAAQPTDQLLQAA